MNTARTFEQFKEFISTCENPGILTESERFLHRLSDRRPSRWMLTNLAGFVASDLSEEGELCYSVLRDHQEYSDTSDTSILDDISSVANGKTLKQLRLISGLERSRLKDLNNYDVQQIIARTLREVRLKIDGLNKSKNRSLSEIQKSVLTDIKREQKNFSRSINLNTFEEIVKDVLKGPHKVLITELLFLLADYLSNLKYGKKTITKGRNKNFYSRFFNDAIRNLIKELLKEQDISFKSIMIALKVARDGLKEFDEQELQVLVDLFLQKIGSTSNIELSNAIIALLKLETCIDSLKTMIMHMFQRFETLIEQDLSILLQACCLLNYPGFHIIQILDRLKEVEKSRNVTIKKCFYAAVAYDYDLDFWKGLFLNNLQGCNKPYADFRRSNGEITTAKFLREYLDERGVEYSMEVNKMEWGFEMDFHITLPDGQIVNVEYDGKFFHTSEGLRDDFRDKVLEKLGIIAVRVDSSCLQKLKRLSEDRRLKLLDEKLRGTLDCSLQDLDPLVA
ncbi:hypothetical protein ACFL21_03665 [Patescibacteria group bacterium]